MRERLSTHFTAQARPVNTVQPRPTVNSARPMSNTFNKSHSSVRRPFNNLTAKKNSNFYHRVNIVKGSGVNTARLRSTVNTARPKASVNAARPRVAVNAARPKAVLKAVKGNLGNPEQDLQEKGIFDSGCFRHMTGNKPYLTDFEEIDGGFVTFGGNSKGGTITGKHKIRTGNLDFNDVYFVKELKFNLFSVSQMCDKKNIVLFTDTECFVLSSNFKLTDENHVLLKVPRKDNMYSVDLKNIFPKGGLTCLFAKATSGESKLWHKRPGHINFKTLNKLVKGNLVRGLPSKHFEINQTCIACQKGKQHRASCKSKEVSSISKPLQMLHMDLFGPTFVKSLMKKMYCLVVTDDFSRCDNGTEFKNRLMNEFCEMKGIKREFSVARNPQQNGVAERKNKTLIEVDRTMLADSKLLTTFWAEAVNTAFYVQNRVLVIKPHNKTPYELFFGRKPALGFMRPFGYPIIILNTIDHLGKFDGKADEGFFVGYSLNSKAYRVFNSKTRIVEDNMHPVVAGNQSNGNARTKASNDAGKTRVETVPGKDYILLLLWTIDSLFSSLTKSSPDDGFKPPGDAEKKDNDDPREESGNDDQEKEDDVNSTNTVNATSTNEVNAIGTKTSIELPDDPDMPPLEEIIYSDDDEDVSAEADMTNLDTHILVSPILTTIIHKDHPVDQIIRDIHSAPQTRRMIKSMTEHAMFSTVQQRVNHKDFQNCLFTCFLSQEQPKKVYRNKKDERGIVIRNKARLIAQGHTQKEGIDYDEVFALVARIEAIRLFLAYASYRDFVVYQMDVKSAFLYGKIEEEVYVCQPFGFEDPNFPDRVYKVEKALYGLHQALRAWKEMCIEFEKMMHKKFQMSSMTELTFFLGLQQDADGEDVDEHLYRSMIRSLMYLTSSRPDITFAVCACARFQVNSKISHLHAVKRIFRYLKGQPKLGLWYPKDSPFDLVAHTDSDYAGASLDRKSTTRGCQFLGYRLISWQCKKQTVVANSTIEAEYIAASNCCSQVCLILNVLIMDENEVEMLLRRELELKLLIGMELKFLLLLQVNAVKHRLITAAANILNANPIKYALTINPTIFESCVEQFWSTRVVKKVNGDVQIHALIDGKRIVVSKPTIRRDLQFADEGGVDCLPTAIIFEEIARMWYEKPSQKLTFYKAFFSPKWKFMIHTILQCLSAKTTTWNEFSSTVALAIICLATNHKLSLTSQNLSWKVCSGT
ncbi:ribonuclease H-like domain-containing protein [Tanacetum coccineum]